MRDPIIQKIAKDYDITYQDVRGLIKYYWDLNYSAMRLGLPVNFMHYFSIHFRKNWLKNVQRKPELHSSKIHIDFRSPENSRRFTEREVRIRD